MEHEQYMKMALEQAKQAFDDNEVPIGCVIIGNDGAVLGTGRNAAARHGNALYHAELLAINEASVKTGDFRLSEAVMYVTIEPCPMCAGAIIMSRIGTVVYGAKNPKAGCAGSIYNLLDEPRFNHRPVLISGVLEDECGALMTEFFRSRLKKI